MPSECATARSVAPHSFLRRRISRIRRIDTLSAGIGFPPVAGLRRTGAGHQPAVERSPPKEWPTSDRNGRHHLGISGRDHLGISGRLGPESAGYEREKRQALDLWGRQVANVVGLEPEENSPVVPLRQKK